jgi:hypothetical protein
MGRTWQRERTFEEGRDGLSTGIWGWMDLKGYSGVEVGAREVSSQRQLETTVSGPW